MGKGYGAAVITAVGLDEQQRYFAIAIGYSTPMRITNYDANVIIPAGSGNVYYPWSLDVLEPAIGVSAANDVTIVIGNGDLTGVSTLTGRPATLDWAQDSRGKTLTIYECTVGSTGRTDTLVFSGVVDEFSAADDSGTCRIVATPADNIGSRPGSNFCMSICRWRKFKGDDCQFAGAATTCTRTLADCRRKVGAATITGSGLDDMTSGGTFSGTAILQYRVEIDGSGTPDTFKWSDNGGSSWDATTVAITGAAQTLNNGVTVTFAATTGHAVNNYWDFQASWEDYFGNLLHAPAAGTIIEVNGYPIQVPQSHGGYWRGPQTPPPAGGGGNGGTLQPPPAGYIGTPEAS
jgi:hypothetical protein